MSNSPANELFARVDEAVPQFGHSLLAPVRGIAFWIAIALPFLYVPLLASGLESSAVRLAFVALVVCNVVALLVGHPYARD
jgi:formate-dependent nitrite reductase membrane component NrfD